MRTNQAFTLIEIITVVALLGILGISVIVMTPSVSKSRLEAAAQKVRTDIELAKQNAELTTVKSGVVFVSGGSYTVYQNTSATPIKSPLNQQNLVVTLSGDYPGISISSNYTVEFNKLGQPTTGGGSSVTITDGTNNKILSITAGTGKVTIQ